MREPELPPLGAHLSVRGGLPEAIRRGTALRCTAGQVFVKNASQWRAPALAGEVCDAFCAAHGASRIGPLLAHASYLANLAAPSPAVRERTVAELGEQLRRCARLGIGGLVLHPGAHMGAGAATGLRRAARTLDRVLASAPPGPRVLLELTAGAGSLLGGRLEELEEIVARSQFPDRLGVCLDTCHAFAGGYAIDEPAGYEAFWEELDRRLGHARLGGIHLNDSVHPRGSRRDRHAPIGLGAIGDDLFTRLLRDDRLRRVPMILETPSDDQDRGHARDLRRLRRLARPGDDAAAPQVPTQANAAVSASSGAASRS